MLTEKIDKKNKTILIETDYEFSEFKIDKYKGYFQFDFIKNKYESMGSCLFFNLFGGRKYYPKEITIENINIELKTIYLSYS
jgi:hypothetical protein